MIIELTAKASRKAKELGEMALVDLKDLPSGVLGGRQGVPLKSESLSGWEGWFTPAQLSRASTLVAQFLVITISALALKLYYSTVSVNELRWILAPTTTLVELITGRQFDFENHAGYMSSDHTFLIAASCAGVNFLITAFLMLSLRELWKHRFQKMRWIYLPAMALVAYLVTIVANTVRISVALWLQRNPLEISWLSSNQLHRFEGIFVYFGFLLLLFVVSERISSTSGPRLVRQALFPLLIYYATALGIPLLNGVLRSGKSGPDFWEHLAFVLLIPLPLMLIVAIFDRINRIYKITNRLGASIAVRLCRLT